MMIIITIAVIFLVSWYENDYYRTDNNNDACTRISDVCEWAQKAKIWRDHKVSAKLKKRKSEFVLFNLAKV